MGSRGPLLTWYPPAHAGGFYSERSARPRQALSVSDGISYKP